MPDSYAHTRAYLSHLSREYQLTGNLADDSSSETEALVKKIVQLLEDEDEDGLKALIKQTYSIDDAADPSVTEQLVLDLMHKHKDDLQGVPFSAFKRPVTISRPSSRASTHSFNRRPETPSSPLAKSLSLRRPHTPIASPLSAGLHAPAGGGLLNGIGPSPGSSPTTAHMAPLSMPPHLAPGSQPSSPLTSPHFLNAKALEFRPTAAVPRPGSAMSGSGSFTRADSPDLWAHHVPIPNSPSRRASGSLAIASPLGGDGGYYPRPAMGMGMSVGGGGGAVGAGLTRSNSGLRKSMSTHYMTTMTTSPGIGAADDGDPAMESFVTRLDDDDNLSMGVSGSPFAKAAAMNMPRSTANTHLDLFDDNPVGGFAYPNHLRSMLSPSDDSEEISPSTNGLSPSDSFDPSIGDGMTPFEVLHSVFGSTIPPATLDDALQKNGYDFEAAMAYLIDNGPSASKTTTSPPTPPAPKPPVPVPGSGGRVMTVSRDVLPIMKGGAVAAAQAGGNPHYFGQRVAVATGGRVCRYYLAGECRRSDCRFSHDIERALCRFWLKGQCMKGEQCEFLHTLPQDIDVNAIANAMTGTKLGEEERSESPPVEAFPTLGAATARRGVAGAAAMNDASRTRFAAAVKKPAPAPPPPSSNVPPQRAPIGSNGSSGLGVRRVPTAPEQRNSPATPRPSPRIKLRPPSLLPTLPTGKVMNDLYMSYRARAIEFGGQRNVALSRAAEAWKRGDGAAAKHWSRTAHELNDKMAKEMGESAGRVIKERARVSVEAVQARDTGWSDDPYDRSARGKVAGAGLGVLLGVASERVGGVGVGGGKLTSEERTEALLDLHGLHSTEGVEVLEEFLLALEKEHFLGLAYVVVGEEKHTGTQDPNRGASRLRLAAGVKEFLHRWQYPWNERDGVVCVDPLTHS